MFVSPIKVSHRGGGGSLLEEFADFLAFHMIKRGDSAWQQEMFSSRLRLSHGVIALHPTSLPRGLRVILTPVIYGAAALHSA